MALLFANCPCGSFSRQWNPLSSDVKARARAGWRGFQELGLRKSQAQALGRIYVRPGLGSGLGRGLAGLTSLNSQDNMAIEIYTTSS
jgi:hypothetical protein